MQVFISVRGKSGLQVAQRLAALLDQTVPQAWLYTQAVAKGQSITAAVRDAIAQARAAVLVYSADYLESSACFLELAAIISRLHESDHRFVVWVLTPNHERGHVHPRELRDLRRSWIWPQVSSAEFAKQLREQLAGLAPATVPELRAVGVAPQQFGYVPVMRRLLVPIGQEHSFWQLHDSLHGAATAQTSLSQPRRTVTLAGMAGAGVPELALAYAELLGSCFRGGVFWLEWTGDDAAWLSSLRDVAESLGIDAELMSATSLRGSLMRALGARGHYLWVVLARGDASVQPPWASAAPSAQGQALVLREDLAVNTNVDVLLGALSREATARAVAGLLANDLPSQPAAEQGSEGQVAALCDAVFSISAGHLASVQAGVALAGLVGAELATQRMAMLLPAEAGLQPFVLALADLPQPQQACLHALGLLPAEVAAPNALVVALLCNTPVPTSDDADALAAFAALRRTNILAQTPDQRSAFVAQPWLRALGLAATAVARPSQGGEPTPEPLRARLVASLLVVMPVNTRARKTHSLAQLERLASAVLVHIETAQDCALAVRCAAIHALYGEHAAQEHIVRRALAWARHALGPDHPTTVGLICDWVQCPSMPRDDALRLTGELLARAPQWPSPALRLRVALAHCIELGDRSPTQAQAILEEVYGSLAQSSEIEPLQHARVLNSIAVFQAAFQPQTAQRHWSQARALLAKHHLQGTDEALRIDANLASLQAQQNPQAAFVIGQSIHQRQLASKGADHHLTLWAAVDLLRYALGAGEWGVALELLTNHLRQHREAVLQLDAAGSAAGLMDQVMSGTLLPPGTNQLMLQNLARLVEARDLAIHGWFKQPALFALPRSKQDIVTRMLVFMELLEFQAHPEAHIAAVLDDFLQALPRLEPLDWAPLRERLPGYYGRFDARLVPTRQTRAPMRRLAKVLAGKTGFWQSLRLVHSARAQGLPVRHL